MLKFSQLLKLVPIAALAGCLSLYGCSSEAPNSDEEQTEAAEEAQEASAEEAAYSVTIDDATVGVDYEGNPALIVTFTFSNISGDTESAATVYLFDGFQDGAQLDMAIGDGWDSEGYLDKVKQGGSKTFQLGYKLESESDVEIEVGEIFSLDNTLAASQTFSVS